jgi:hypothetical protein
MQELYLRKGPLCLSHGAVEKYSKIVISEPGILVFLIANKEVETVLSKRIKERLARHVSRPHRQEM